MNQKNILKIIIVVICICTISLVLFLNQNKKTDQSESLQQNNNTNSSNKLDHKEQINSEEVNNLNIDIMINEKVFSVNLIDNETSRKFIALLPLEITMNELNGNEKYHYLEETLPTNLSNQSKINEGDLMLYGPDCLVLFYESFTTSYRYTKLGTINNPDGLKEAVGKGDVKVRFENR